MEDLNSEANSNTWSSVEEWLKPLDFGLCDSS